MACGGCEKRREAIKKAVEAKTLASAKDAANYVVKSAAQDIRNRIRFLTVR